MSVEQATVAMVAPETSQEDARLAERKADGVKAEEATDDENTNITSLDPKTRRDRSHEDR